MAKISTADCVKKIDSYAFSQIREYPMTDVMNFKWKRYHKSGKNPVVRIFFNDKFPIKAVVKEDNNTIVSVKLVALTSWDIYKYTPDNDDILERYEDQQDSAEHANLVARTIKGSDFSFDVDNSDDGVYFVVSPNEYPEYDQHMQSYVQHLDPVLFEDELTECTFGAPYEKEELILKLQALGMTKRSFL